MPGFMLRMPAGIPGNLSRGAPDSTVRQEVILTSAPPTGYGQPLVMDAATSKVRAVTSTDAGASIYGFLVRPWPGQSMAGVNDPIGVSTPPVAGIVNILKRGYISVMVNGAIAPVKEAPVYVRVAGAVAGKPVGGVEGGVDPTTAANTVLIPGAFFTGAADASGNCEVEFNI